MDTVPDDGCFRGLTGYGNKKYPVNTQEPCEMLRDILPVVTDNGRIKGVAGYGTEKHSLKYPGDIVEYSWTLNLRHQNSRVVFSDYS